MVKEISQSPSPCVLLYSRTRVDCVLRNREERRKERLMQPHAGCSVAHAYLREVNTQPTGGICRPIQTEHHHSSHNFPQSHICQTSKLCCNNKTFLLLPRLSKRTYRLCSSCIRLKHFIFVGQLVTMRCNKEKMISCFCLIIIFHIGQVDLQNSSTTINQKRLDVIL